MIEPLTISFVVACGAEHAFSTWTARTSAWWPRQATMSGEASVDVVFEPGVGGRIFERTADGTEIDWGEITLWDPPRRLGYLWHIATDRASATDVEIAFVEVADKATRVEIQHGGWERLGAATAQSWRDTNRAGWDGVMPAYIGECAAHQT